jgi:hypothetical protein
MLGARGREHDDGPLGYAAVLDAPAFEGGVGGGAAGQAEHSVHPGRVESDAALVARAQRGRVSRLSISTAFGDTFVRPVLNGAASARRRDAQAGSSQMAADRARRRRVAAGGIPIAGGAAQTLRCTRLACQASEMRVVVLAYGGCDAERPSRCSFRAACVAKEVVGEGVDAPPCCRIAQCASIAAAACVSGEAQHVPTAESKANTATSQRESRSSGSGTPP